MNMERRRGFFIIVASAFLIIGLAMTACTVGGSPAATVMPSPTPTPTVTPVPADATPLPTPNVPSTIDASKLKSAANRIAYMGVDGQVFTADPDGKNRIQITQAGTYSWPTWSPDGKSLTYSGLTRDSAGNNQIALYLGSPFGGNAKTLFINNPNVPAAIAVALFHYVMWSLDSTKIVFVAQTQGTGLTLFEENPYDVWDPTQVLGGGPLYSAWSPDSKYLMVHRGKDTLLVDTSVYPNATDLGITSSAYEAPQWSLSGDRVLVSAVAADGSEALTMLDAQGKVLKSVMPLKSQASFLWSPSGETAAVTEWQQADSAYKGITLISKDGSVLKSLTDKELIAFLWSPDGKKIIYATPPDAKNIQNWVLIDVASSQETTLGQFEATDEFSTYLDFFDQFAQSHSIWSPDSKSIVYGAYIPGTGLEAQQQGKQPQPFIYRLDVESGKPATIIADGTLAVWSWK